MGRLRVLPAALAAVPLAFAAGALEARWALLGAPRRIAVDLAQPLPVVTAWQGFGALLWGILALTTLAAGAAAVFAVLELRRRPPGTAAALGLILTASAATLAVALAWPVVFSSDVYAYAAYGDVAARGGDPYAHAIGPAGGAIAAASAWQWGGTTPACVYGPAFVAAARALVLLVGGMGAGATLLAFRLGACVAFLLAAAALYRALPGPREHRLAATAAFALNPVALWSVAEGHNDAFMLAFALGGAALVRLGVPISGGAAIALASLFKAPGIVTGAGLVLFGNLWAGAQTRRLAAALALGALLVAPLAVLGLRGVVEAASGLGVHGHYLPQYSFQALGVLVARAFAPADVAPAIGIAGALLVCIAAALIGLRGLRARDATGIAWLAVAVWLAVPNPYPWYALWVLPIAVAALDQAVFLALLGATISIQLRYLPDAFGLMPHLKTLITVLQFAPLLYALRALPGVASAEEPAIL